MQALAYLAIRYDDALYTFLLSGIKYKNRCKINFLLVKIFVVGFYLKYFFFRSKFLETKFFFRCQLFFTIFFQN